MSAALRRVLSGERPPTFSSIRSFSSSLHPLFILSLHLFTSSVLLPYSFVAHTLNASHTRLPTELIDMGEEGVPPFDSRRPHGFAGDCRTGMRIWIYL